MPACSIAGPSLLRPRPIRCGGQLGYGARRRPSTSSAPDAPRPGGPGLRRPSSSGRQTRRPMPAELELGSGADSPAQRAPSDRGVETPSLVDDDDPKARRHLPTGAILLCDRHSPRLFRAPRRAAQRETPFGAGPALSAVQRARELLARRQFQLEHAGHAFAARSERTAGCRSARVPIEAERAPERCVSGPRRRTGFRRRGAVPARAGTQRRAKDLPQGISPPILRRPADCGEGKPDTARLSSITFDVSLRTLSKEVSHEWEDSRHHE